MVGLALAAAALVFATLAPGASGGVPNPRSKFIPGDCGDQQTNALCAETFDAKIALHENYYVGHDEPELAFYSSRPGSGYNMTYQVTLPKDPNVLPTQSSPGAFWNFQLRPTFWLGLVMCDTQSYPQFTTTCTPDSDTNIKNDANPSSPNFIGKHAGAAYEELQFYPPGWANWAVGTSCDPSRWCAALNIDSLSENGATGADLNPTCQGQVLGGTEYINFAFVTRSGIPQGPPGPKSSLLSPTSLVPDPSQDLMMRGGDKLLVTLHDTFQGFQVVIADQNTHQTGTMTASAANGFSQIQAAPTGTACNEIPYNFHAMYATASEQTRNPWGAHASGNAVLSDEIGHWDYCDNIPSLFAPCAGNEGGQGEAPSPADGDDIFCLGPGQDPFGTMFVQVGGCEFENDGFDGTSYVASDWPGNGNQLAPAPLRFHSPYINGSKFQTYDRVAFETDLPRIERPNPNNAFLNCVGAVTTNPTGAGCTNPPSTDAGEQAYYPMYSTHQTTGPLGACEWQEGGTGIPGTLNTFGGSSATEYGSLVAPTYQASATTTTQLWEDFRNIVKNPCPN
jgi:hypothetical protein